MYWINRTSRVVRIDSSIEVDRLVQHFPFVAWRRREEVSRIQHLLRIVTSGVVPMVDGTYFVAF
jgi:hypothetical protein